MNAPMALDYGQRLNLFRGRILHVRQLVRIYIERKSNAGMAELLTDDFGRNASCGRNRSGRMPKVIEPDRRQCSSFQVMA